jgi:hypothetical protein
VYFPDERGGRLLTRLQGTPEQQLIYLNTHWGREYAFTAPAETGDRWMAAARFGQRDELQEESAAELLLAVRQHYTVNRPG